jgi:aspartate carbamoyltransferase catalytic subunit
MIKLKKPEFIHFTDLDTLNGNDIFYLIQKAHHFRNIAIDAKTILPTLTGRVVTNLFFEPSTRTLNSFLLAAKRLSAATLAPNLAYCSTLKGESLVDTIQTFEAMGTDIFVIRHSDNHTPEFISNELNTSARVINAGDGTNRHPTQAMLDLMTIYENKHDFAKLSVAIVGDINHSRVAHSLIPALKKVGVNDIRLVGPEVLVDTSHTAERVKVCHNLIDGISNCDVVITLRMQKERFEKHEKLDLSYYQKEFCVTQEVIKHAHKDVIIMHPGPMNRNVEISSQIADSTRSMIREQVKNGVAMRMAILDTLLTNN